MIHTEKLRQRLRDTGFSLREIEKATGIDRSNLAKFRQGNAGITYENGMALAMFLDLETPSARRLEPPAENPKPPQPKPEPMPTTSRKILTEAEVAKRKRLGLPV